MRGTQCAPARWRPKTARNPGDCKPLFRATPIHLCRPHYGRASVRRCMAGPVGSRMSMTRATPSVAEFTIATAPPAAVRFGSGSSWPRRCCPPGVVSRHCNGYRRSTVCGRFVSRPYEARPRARVSALLLGARIFGPSVGRMRHLAGAARVRDPALRRGASSLFGSHRTAGARRSADRFRSGWPSSRSISLVSSSRRRATDETLRCWLVAFEARDTQRRSPCSPSWFFPFPRALNVVVRPAGGAVAARRSGGARAPGVRDCVRTRGWDRQAYLDNPSARLKSYRERAAGWPHSSGATASSTTSVVDAGWGGNALHGATCRRIRCDLGTALVATASQLRLVETGHGSHNRIACADRAFRWRGAGNPSAAAVTIRLHQSGARAPCWVPWSSCSRCWRTP